MTQLHRASGRGLAKGEFLDMNRVPFVLWACGMCLFALLAVTGTVSAGWSGAGIATLTSRAWNDNDALVFETGQVVANSGDFLIETNIIFLGKGVEFRSLGAGSLELTRHIPTDRYTASVPTGLISIGELYAFRLTDGTFGVVEFSAIAATGPGNSTHCDIRYRLFSTDVGLNWVPAIQSLLRQE